MSNFPEHIVTFGLYLQALKSHDWTFEHSDDQSAWRRGAKERAMLKAAQPVYDVTGVYWNQKAPEGFKIMPKREPSGWPFPDDRRKPCSEDDTLIAAIDLGLQVLSSQSAPAEPKFESGGGGDFGGGGASSSWDSGSSSDSSSSSSGD